MKILEEKNNSLASRHEFKAIIESEKNPTFDEVSEIVAKHFKGEKENVAIKEIRGKFGRGTFKISAFMYSSKEAKENFEPKKKVKSVPGQPAKK